MRDYRALKNFPEAPPVQGGQRQGQGGGDAEWVTGFREGRSTYGDFLLAGPISKRKNGAGWLLVPEKRGI